MVTLDGSSLHFESRVAWVARTGREYKPPSPHDGKVTIKLADSRARVRPSDGVPIGGGWMHAFDNGEFGGGIYWFPRGKPTPILVSSRNTPLLIATSKGCFAIEVLDHMSFSYSRLVRLSRVSTRWVESLVTDLHEAPGEVIQDDNRFVVAMHGYISTVETDGTQREIYRRGFSFDLTGDPGFQSMVRCADGEIWVGSSQGVLRLRPRPDGEYAAQWFLPLK